MMEQAQETKMNSKGMNSTELPYKIIEDLVNQLITPAELKPGSIDEVVKLPSFFEKIKECESIFQTSYSEIDHSIQDTLVLRRLQQMTNTLMLNPFWKERIEQSGLREAPRNFEEWQQLPISDKTAQSDIFMGSRPGLVVPLSYGGFEVVASGGTSGGLPVETIYSLRELHDTYKIAGNFMGQYVLRDYLAGDDPKWVATTLADSQMWSAGTMVGGVLQHIPGINYIGAGPLAKEVYQHMMSYKGPKAIMGTSQEIGILADLGEGLSQEARNSFRVALYGSGLLTPRTQLELKDFYPNLSILSFFAASQAETIGLQLTTEPYLATVPGLHLVEIVDDKGRWVAEGEEGELVVTRLHAHEAPFPRYKVGDRVRRLSNIDGPGLKTQRFEFLGRSGDVIHLGDTKYPAPLVYDSLCHELKLLDVLDLETLAHEIQFLNNRRDKILSLIVAVDDVFTFASRAKNILGNEKLRNVFIESLSCSLSIFNTMEANANYLETTGYNFEIKLVNKGTNEIYRTGHGKIPLIKEVF